VPDLKKIRALGLPFWLVGSYATPARLAEALNRLNDAAHTIGRFVNRPAPMNRAQYDRMRRASRPSK